MTAWQPWATRDPISGFPGGSTSGTARKITIHTTETAGKPGWGRNPGVPHFTLDPATGQAWQHIDCGRSAYSLESPGPPRSPNMNAGTVHVQLEVIGRAADVPGYPDTWYERLSGWLRLLCTDLGVPPVFPFPFTGQDGYGRDGKVRQTWDDYAAASGIVGHSHAPGNSHWDPGRLDTTRLRLTPTDDPDPQEGMPGMRQVAYRAYNKATKKNNRRFPRGSWQTVIAGLEPGKAGYVQMTGQLLIRPTDAPGAWVRFVRVRPGKPGDGTGDIWVPADPRGAIKVAHNHTVKGGRFTVDVQVKVPGAGPFTVAYAYGKLHA